jgi:hypothetical protein
MLDALVGCSLLISVWSVFSCRHCFLWFGTNVFGKGVFCGRCFFVALLQFHCSLWIRVIVSLCMGWFQTVVSCTFLTG